MSATADIEQNEQKKKKKTVSERIKMLNYKQLIRAATMILGLVVIILMTIFQLGINENINWSEWMTNCLIMVGITLFGLYMGDSSWEDHLKVVPNGLFQVALHSFEDQEKKVHDKMPYFSGYYVIHCSKELIEKKANYLANEGIPGSECIALAKNLRDYDIPKIFEEAIERVDEEGKPVKLCRVEEKNADAVRDMMTITLSAPNYSYFMTATNQSDVLGLAENGRILPKKRRSSKTFNFGFKVITGIIFSAIFAWFTVKEFAMGGDEAARLQAWMNLLSRISHLCTSFAAGCSTAVIDIRIASDEIDNKTMMLLEYQTAIDKKEYFPETYEQKFEREKKEAEEANRKAVESVIIPQPADKLLLENHGE